ncbi:sirohydrochlorin chelatase [Streptomyces sp. NPDC054766]|uniref:sirohydrochlorin chelatase n=1 Tax=Streptomyces rhizosphaerihabitans TaxID=1266770 RepID=UPI003704B0D1
MTASNPARDASSHRLGGPPPRGAHLEGPLDSTAQLMNRITSQLGSQLSLVSLDGTRRPPPPALVLAAHGSRDPRALATVRTLIERVRELRPHLSVRLGHIELNEPLLRDTLASLAGKEDAVLVPLLLGRGYHVRRDIPGTAAAVPGLNTRVAAPLGPHPLLVETLYARLVEAGWRTRMSDSARRASAVVLASAGSRSPDSAADTRRTAQLLAERLGVPVVPAYASAAAPTVPAAVRSLAARGRHRIAVASYFTAPGRFATQCAEEAPWICAEPLGDHPAMARLVLHRYDQAVAVPEPAPERTLVPA